MTRVYLSPPHLTGEELEALREALASNWIAPLGPNVDAFERELAHRVGVAHALAVSSGTAALHLAVKLLGLGAGDEVICPTLTFAASVNPVLYEGATPVFLDVDPASWNLDPELLARELDEAATRGRLPRAVIVVDVLGQSADHEPIRSTCARHGVPVIEDAAEALGASYHGEPVGRFGRFGVFSFNGNKIITASGGGMLVSDDGDAIARARFLATQAREAEAHYEHREIGFNYRMSNLLAAVGRVQLRALDLRVEQRRAIFDRYLDRLGELEGVSFMPEAPYGRSSRWLTCVLIDPQRFGANREDVRLALAREDIEARPVWKPLHLQPAYSGYRHVGGEVSEHLFEQGLCLPSGSSLGSQDQERICAIFAGCRGGGAA